MTRIILSDHAKCRLIERGIDVHEVNRIAKNGAITKKDADGTITKSGICSNGKRLLVVLITENTKIVIKTAYYHGN
jgi:hypothetical protein